MPVSGFRKKSNISSRAVFYVTRYRGRRLKDGQTERFSSPPARAAALKKAFKIFENLKKAAVFARFRSFFACFSCIF
jgi:hypothetical protein